MKNRVARPIKDGVDYFPLDTGFFQDDKIRLIKAEFGAKGIVILLTLLCEIYRDTGYFKAWDKDSCLLMAEAVGCGVVPENITQVVQGCLRRSIFDNGVFQMFGILTSAGIQRRYIRAVSTRDEITVIQEYWLLDTDDKKDVPAGILNKLAFKSVPLKETPENLKKTPRPLQNNPQSRGKESRGKESRVEESRAAPPPPQPTYPALAEAYGKPLVDAYIAKARRYKKREEQLLLVAAQWLAEDKAAGRLPKQPVCKEHSFDLEEYEQAVREFRPVYRKENE